MEQTQGMPTREDILRARSALIERQRFALCEIPGLDIAIGRLEEVLEELRTRRDNYRTTADTATAELRLMERALGGAGGMDEWLRSVPSVVVPLVEREAWATVPQTASSRQGPIAGEESADGPAPAPEVSHGEALGPADVAEPVHVHSTPTPRSWVPIAGSVVAQAAAEPAVATLPATEESAPRPEQGTESYPPAAADAQTPGPREDLEAEFDDEETGTSVISPPPSSVMGIPELSEILTLDTLSSGRVPTEFLEDDYRYIDPRFGVWGDETP